jgi:hypothetical protein
MTRKARSNLGNLLKKALCSEVSAVENTRLLEGPDACQMIFVSMAQERVPVLWVGVAMPVNGEIGAGDEGVRWRLAESHQMA